MRGRGAVILAVLTALAPACGGGGTGAGGGPLPLVFTPLTPVDTSSPDHTVDTSKSDAAITTDLNTYLAAGGIIVFNNGGTPKTITLTAQLDLAAFKSAVIDGKGNVTLSGATSGRILLKRFQSNLTVQGLAFINATTTTPPPVVHEGAAILTEWDGYLTVINCQFTNCKTTALTGPDIGGGGIRPLGQRRVQVSGCTFNDCDGPNGGGIDSIGSQITLINTSFTGCNATGTGGGAEQGVTGQGGIGGAVYIDGVSQMGDQHRLDIVGCTFTNNSANDHGGALFGYTIKGTGSIVNIDQCTFSGNSVTDTTAAVGFGGAIYQQNNQFTLTRSTINGNTSTYFGGGVWSSCKSGTIENCTFQGNQAQGGVVPTRARFGGALFISGTILINSCTISGSHAQDWGGGIFAGTPSKITLNNTLLMNNTGTSMSDGWNVNETLGHGKNNLQFPTNKGAFGPDVPARPDIVFLDAQLQALGGPLPQTMAILPGSPAIDAGDDKTAPDTDQRGLPRVGTADIGAFEKQ